MKLCEVLTALWELFSSVGIWNLLHTPPSSFLCRGDFAFCFTKIVPSGLGCIASVSLHGAAFLYSLNCFESLFPLSLVICFHTWHLLVSKANPSPCVCASALWSPHVPSHELRHAFVSSGLHSMPTRGRLQNLVPLFAPWGSWGVTCTSVISFLLRGESAPQEHPGLFAQLLSTCVFSLLQHHLLL